MSASTGPRHENAGGSPLEARPADLVIRGLWSADGHRFARWSPAGRERIRSGAARLRTELAQWISPHCAHARGHGGVKGAVRFAHAACARLPFAARFDVRSSLRVQRSPRASRSAGPGRGCPGDARSRRPVPRAPGCAPQRPGPGGGRRPVALADGPLSHPFGPRHGAAAAQGRPLRAVHGRPRHLRPDAAQAETRDPQHARRAASAAPHRSSRQTLHRQIHQGVRSSGVPPAARTQAQARRAIHRPAHPACPLALRARGRRRQAPAVRAALVPHGCRAASAAGSAAKGGSPGSGSSC